MAQYDIFLSFSVADTSEVNSLIERLQRDIPGIRIFYDMEGKGNELSEFERTRIIKAIDDSSIVVFALSENSLKNEDCEKEVMYAKNTCKRIIPYLLPGMTLKGWLLYELGRINCVDSTNEEEVSRFIETLRQRLSENGQNVFSQSSNDNNPRFDTSFHLQTQQNIPSASSESLPEIPPAIETQLVFDPNTGEFVSRVISNNQPRITSNSTAVPSSQSLSNHEEPISEPPKKLYLNGHEFVDLGLPSGLKWAASNLGSYKPEDPGVMFSWGEVKPMRSFFAKNSESYQKDIQWLKDHDYVDDNGNLKPSHDAARKNWGSSWRMPTKDEIEELHSNTTSSWHRVNGVDGCMLTSKLNGNSIFFPAFGRKEGLTTKDKGNLGMFWSSTVSGSNDNDAYRMAVGLNLFSIRETARYIGLSVRAVSE